MIKYRNKKLLALLLTLCMVFSWNTGVHTAKGQTEQAKAKISEDDVIQVMAATGAAITFYVGGSGASDANKGTGVEGPFATLARASQAVNLSGTGLYEIVMLGDTCEVAPSQFGDGQNNIQVSIRTVTGSAIIIREPECTGDIITVADHASLSLGDSSGEYSSTLTINGGRGYKNSYTKDGSIIKVQNQGTLSLYEDVVLRDNFHHIDTYKGNGGAVYNNGTFLMYGGSILDNLAAYAGSGVYNVGTFRLYGGLIQNNYYAYQGSGVYNGKGGSFEMFDGQILDNESEYGSGVFNDGIFRLKGGTISGNSAYGGGGIYNYSLDALLEISGGLISNNLGYLLGGGIYSYGNIVMTGGTIRNNVCESASTPYDDINDDNGGGIYHGSGSFTMSGGSLEGNSAELGGAVYISDRAEFRMSGGMIDNNTAEKGGALYVDGQFTISGNAEIPGASNPSNNVYTTRPIKLGGDLYSSERISLTLDSYTNAVGVQCLEDEFPGLASKYYTNFILTNSNYSLNQQGIIEFLGSLTTYYVGGEGAKDTNSGTSPEQAFATLEHAVEVGNDAFSCFILQADQELTREIKLKGTLTIRGDGTPRRITRSKEFSGYNLFLVDEGTIVHFGSSDNSDPADSLIIDGENRFAYYAVIKVKGTLNLHSGVSIQNHDLGNGCILNYAGTVNIYEGCRLEANSTEEMGIITNYGTLRMFGGTICNNTGSAIVNLKDRYDGVVGSVFMTGGEIYGNEAVYGKKAAYGDEAVYGDAISNQGLLELSGSVSFPEQGGSRDDIFLMDADSVVTLAGDFDTMDPIPIRKENYYDGERILVGAASLINTYHTKFVLDNPHYALNHLGEVYYSLSINNYYVNSAGSDDNPGTEAAPYATLNKAVEQIGDGKGVIVVQSDLTLLKSVVIQGNITLMTDGKVHTIYRGEPFEEYSGKYFDYSPMLLVYGKLNLGNPKGGDQQAKLILDGGGEDGIVANAPIILNRGYLNLYDEAVLQNNNSATGGSDGTALISQGTLYMYGGRVQNNNSDMISGIAIIGGSFVMEGGTICNNLAESFSGVFVEGAEFHMSGGRITDNRCSTDPNEMGISGVFLATSSFLMHGGEISGNSGLTTGVVSERSNVSIKGGNISDNQGMYNGLIMFDSNLRISGGSIGGESKEGISHIVIMDSKLFISGEFQIQENNQIVCRIDDISDHIYIEGPLHKGGPVKQIRVLLYNAAIGDYDESYTIGQQIISGSQYTVTEEDISEFNLADPDYAINLSGKIGRAIKDTWVNATANDNLVFNGKVKTFTVKVTDGDTLLTEGSDYIVRYTNNLHAGKASVTVIGTGNYAGKVNRDFTIQKTTALRLETSAPAVSYYKASDKKTEEELLQSITLSEVCVATDTGYFYVPVKWSLTGGTYDPRGGSYTYTATVLGSEDVSVAGLTLTAQIVVLPETPYLQESGAYLAAGAFSDKSVSISYYLEGASLIAEYQLPEGIGGTMEEGALSLLINSTRMIRELEREDIDKLTILLPSAYQGAGDNSNLLGVEAVLAAELLRRAKELGKDLTVALTDASGKVSYSWTFYAADLKNSSEEITDVNLKLSLQEIEGDEALAALLNSSSDTEEARGLIIHFDHEGVLPSQASVRIYVADREGISSGSRIYLYHYNRISNKLETLPFSSLYTVDEEGYITVSLLHCSDYVMLTKEADSSVVSSLRNQIRVNAESELISLGGLKPNTTRIIISLPKTLELVDSLEDMTSQSAIGGVTATFRSTNPKVATVDEKGRVTAKKTGTTSILVTVTLYSGKVKTFHVYIRVKKA